MSEKKLEPCTLGDATHVEVNDKVHLLKNDKIALESYHGEWIGIRWLEEDAFIPIDMFSILGIKTFKEIKPEPIEFEAVFYQYNGHWRMMYAPDCKMARFRCVQIVEED